MWLGCDIHLEERVDNYALSSSVNLFANTALYKQMKLSESTARDIWILLSQEIHCLKEFLPHYYRHTIQKNDHLSKLIN
jgi:formyltetrahydrofolate hydrolase